MTTQQIISALTGKRFNLHDEKALQRDIHAALTSKLPGLTIAKEFVLDEFNIIDFLIEGSLGIEVKIKGGKRDLYRQCERYCEFNTIKQLLLVTNLAVGFPPQIGGKDCYVLKLGNAWL